MSLFVLDNSVTMRWCFQDEGYLYADGVTQAARLRRGDRPGALALRGECSIHESTQEKRFASIRNRRIPATLSKLKINLDPDSSRHILTNVHGLAITYRLSSYDASYLEVALRRNLPLATLDKELIAACKASGVTLLL